MNKEALKRKNSGETIVEIVPFKVEVDEIQSFVENKSNPRWLWHGIDHQTGEVLAYVLGSRTDEMFLKQKKFLKPFGITKFYTDGLKTYERHISPKIRQVSKYKMHLY